MMNRNKGFSLLEILVAFSIMAISLGIILKIFSSGLNTAVVAEEYTIATQIAESLMAKTGVEESLIEGAVSGIENEKYHWTITVEVLLNPVAIDYESNAEFFNVQVMVQWGDDRINGRVVELNTVKTRMQQ